MLWKNEGDYKMKKKVLTKILAWGLALTMTVSSALPVGAGAWK